MNPIRPNAFDPKPQTAATHHPDDDQILAHLSEDLPEQQSVDLQKHLDLCEPCQQRITDLAADTRWWKSASEGLGTLESRARTAKAWTPA